MFCDNQVTVQALNLGASKDLVLQEVLHNLHWECAKFSIMLKASWLRSADNRAADLLSCRMINESFRQQCDDWVHSGACNGLM